MPVLISIVRLEILTSIWIRRVIISNFSRDIQSAIFNAAAEAEIEGGVLNEQGIVADIMSNAVPSLKALLRDSVGKDMPPVIGKYFQDFSVDQVI